MDLEYDLKLRKHNIHVKNSVAPLVNADMNTFTNVRLSVTPSLYEDAAACLRRVNGFPKSKLKRPNCCYRKRCLSK